MFRFVTSCRLRLSKLGVIVLAIALAAPSTLAWPPDYLSESSSGDRNSAYRDGVRVPGQPPPPAEETVYKFYKVAGTATWIELRPENMSLDQVKQGLANGTIEIAEDRYGGGAFGGDANALSDHQTNYGWHYGYQQTFDRNASKIEVDVQINLRFDAAIDDQQRVDFRARCKREMQAWWSNRFGVIKDHEYRFPIYFDVTWDGPFLGDPVQVHEGDGRADSQNLYFNDSAQTLSHEFGHLIGLFDQYWGGALSPGRVVHNDLLMGADYPLPPGAGLDPGYFIYIENWLHSNDPDASQVYGIYEVPEPATAMLTSVVLLCRRRRQNNA